MYEGTAIVHQTKQWTWHTNTDEKGQEGMAQGLRVIQVR